MVNARELLDRLRVLKPGLMATFKVKEIGLFGSWVRGEQREASDVDLLVILDDDADLLDLMGLTLRLEEELQCKVDVVTRRSLRPELQESVLQEVVAV
ncbi:MAG: nucleotidyltransferase domain-containing protein [Thermodesulfobacteriota bacterium]